jgi:hypothetical protein
MFAITIHPCGIGIQNCSYRRGTCLARALLHEAFQSMSTRHSGTFYLKETTVASPTSPYRSGTQVKMMIWHSLAARLRSWCLVTLSRHTLEKGRPKSQLTLSMDHPESIVSCYCTIYRGPSPLPPRSLPVFFRIPTEDSISTAIRTDYNPIRSIIAPGGLKVAPGVISRGDTR